MTAITPSKIKILQWNIRSLSANITALQSNLNELQPQIVSLSETFLNHNDNVSITGFNIFRRTDMMGMGPLICYQEGIEYKQIDIQVQLPPRAQILAIELGWIKF
ncbi:hypothetical protein HHI36_011149 [Cryptolaemus montrouzieri]|uniref:Endonuclease/exonuclease/phosphatase domain-containing protein n=1 Tax=Cryptolaemus montrouzieri TaxID=559131 RepID=A0ABD2MKT1_9CUCU